jgi:hypothetical protein
LRLRIEDWLITYFADAIRDSVISIEPGELDEQITMKLDQAGRLELTTPMGFFFLRPILGHMFTPQRDEKLLAGHFADPRDSCF